MKINKLNIASLIALLPAAAMAQQTIDFETSTGYTNIGVYDCWEQSPLRLGTIAGNAAITTNPDTEENEILGYAPNSSATVLGAQRSRFGSNRMGVRVDLAETFELTTTTKYVHVMVYTPVASRVMLVGLGSRTERTGQNKYAEQFWELSSNSIEANRWTDMVFAVKGAGGIDIRSLVLVPDCESPHNMTEDFLFYIDNIEVNSSATPKTIYDYYALNHTKDTALDRTDRYSTAVSLKGSADGDQTIEINQQNDKLLYQNYLTKHFTAKAGEKLTPAIAYSGTWMNAFFYIDYNNDGKFEPLFNADNTPAEGGELVSYSFCSTTDDNSAGTNSLGTSISGGDRNNSTLPAFTLPATLKPGAYRLRYKIDWASSDPAGNNSSDNDIVTNGGVIADVMLYVHTDAVAVNDNQLNGEVLAADGAKLNNYSAAHGTAFKVQIAPEKGFEQDGLTVFYGYNLGDDQYDKYGNPQWQSAAMARTQFDENGYGTIPAEYMVGSNVRLEGNNAEVGTIDQYPLNFPEDLTFSRTDRHLNGITLTANNEAQTVTADSTTPYKVYTKTLDTVVSAKAGETVSGTIDYTGRAMHGYLYIDWGKDGEFDNSINDDGTPTATSDLVSYSFYQKKNSLGEVFTVAGGQDESFWTILPNFTVNSAQKAGDYYARFVMDWNALYPGGQYGFGSNDIDSNGGGVIDFTFRVLSDESNISEISAAEQTATGACYDLSGRRVNPENVASGIYIINGKKQVISRK
jgi:hypothetical protein